MKKWFFLLLLAGALAAPAVEHGAKATALDRYVEAPDPTYHYELVKTIPGADATTYVIDLTSQTWRKPEEVDKPVWKHWLTIIRPNRLASSIGFLFITGGNNHSAAPDKPDPFMLDIALTTGTVVTELRGVPSEPLIFPGEKPRSEDGIIAYTWDKFLRTGDDNWPLRLPMTKSAVRAMDTVTAFCAKPEGGGVRVDRFVVAGGSKRGWTTWATAAVDPRVAAIVPLSIDVLNSEKSIEHHFRAYGFYSPAIKDYEDMHLMDWGGTPQYRALMHIEDPYEYRERFTMPKLIVSAAGDQYFLPDSSQFYFPELKGEKYLRYVPNTDHSLRNSDARESLIAFYDAVVRGRARPRFSWKFDKDGSIRVSAKDKPTEVKLWQANNPEKRDFRLLSIGLAYKSTVLMPASNGAYVARADKPAKGFTAYFVELTFPSGCKYPFKFTTAVRVTPDVLPFPPPEHHPPALSAQAK
jgi:PhoPQ-activated pathogenicity-related protein